ncbi:MAG: SDR family oxidoreductase [Pseudomonadota bacterium]|nr:SDR family oxidoreductase [Pseudomonadota bacterium]MDE3036918.1 SDR family oxidoreductase [Pseudomonadota bacterium]
MMLANKTVFITGATAGFGRACAELFVKEGARVAACGRRKERLEELKQALSAHSHHPAASGSHPLPEGEGIFTIPLDVRDQQAVEKAVASLPKEFSEVEILINNAGLALGTNAFDKAELADAQQMVETNILGVIYCTRAILPGMVARNRGHIVNLSSVAGAYPYPGGNVYGATKAFVTQFSLNLRADVLGKNIRITDIEPGMAETEFSLVRLHGDAAKADAVYQGVQPLTAEDIAQSILWAVTRPPHVNINRLELMPTQQAFGPFAVHREKR